MTKEYIIWGKGPGKTHDEPLHTLSKSLKEAEQISRILEDEHGCTVTGIQVLDLENAPAPFSNPGKLINWQRVDELLK